MTRTSLLLITALILAGCLLPVTARGGDGDSRFSLRAEGLALPATFLSSRFDSAATLGLAGGGAELRLGEDDREWVFGLGFGHFTTPDRYWLMKGSHQDYAVYSEFDLGILAAWVVREWGTDLTGSLSLRWGFGLGLGFLLGELWATEVIPGCSPEEEVCGHWNTVTRHSVTLDSKVVPLLDAHLGLRYLLAEELSIQLDGGVRDLPFLALSLLIDL